MKSVGMTKSTRSLTGQWTGPQLKVQNLARRSLAPFHMKRRPRADRRPKPASLPSRVGIVDPTVHPLRVEAHRIGNAQNDPLAVLEREQRLRLVARVDWHILAESERVELVHPRVVTRFGA